MTLIDDLSPRSYGEDRIRLTLREPDQALVAFRGILIDVDYSRTLPEGVLLPLIFSVTAPSESGSYATTYRRLAPKELAFTPREGGSHLIRLGERYHNRWFGTLVLDIAGDRIRSA